MYVGYSPVLPTFGHVQTVQQSSLGGWASTACSAEQGKFFGGVSETEGQFGWHDTLPISQKQIFSQPVTAVGNSDQLEKLK